MLGQRNRMLFGLLLAAGWFVPTAADSAISFTCSQPSASIPLGNFIYEFHHPIAATGVDETLDMDIEAVVPDGWFFQVCQTSTGICYFDDTQITIEASPFPDTLRVDFFPNSTEAGMGYIQLNLANANDPLDTYHCTYTLFNGLPVEQAAVNINCSDNTRFVTGSGTVEIPTPIRNVAGFDDFYQLRPVADLPAGWAFQVCQVSTGICYFDEATIYLEAGLADTLRVDFFPITGNGVGRIDLELFSLSNPSVWERCYFRCFRGAHPADVPDVMGSPATAPSLARPNPFTERTSLEFQLTHGGSAVIGIYSSDGRELRRLEAELPQGTSVIDWDGRDNAGTSMPAGAYFYRLTTAREEAKGLIVRSN